MTPATHASTRMEARRIGALAGLAPAAVLVGFYLLSGGSPTLGLVIIAVVAIAAGWLVGPVAGEPRRAALVIAGAYLAVGYLLNLGIGAVVAVFGEAYAGLASGPVVILQSVASLGFLVIAGLIYLPVLGLWLFPIALVWVMAVRLIGGWSGSRQGQEGTHSH